MTANTAPPQPTDSVNVFGFGARVTNALDREHIRTVADLLACDWMRLTDIPSFGVTMLSEVIRTLAEHGMELKESSVPLPPPHRPSRSHEQLIREQIAKEIEAAAAQVTIPKDAEAADLHVAGGRAGGLIYAARIARGEV